MTPLSALIAARELIADLERTMGRKTVMLIPKPFNDERHAAVLALYDRAIELARKEEGEQA